MFMDYIVGFSGLLADDFQ